MGIQAEPLIDPLVNDIATYVDSFSAPTATALDVAWLALFDSLGCAVASTQIPECMHHVGPLAPGVSCNPGVLVPGTGLRVDPVSAAFSTGCLIRWSDFSDTWVALETGHPSDNIGAVLAAAEFTNSFLGSSSVKPLTVNDVLIGMIKAYEIQGVLGLNNSLSQHGFDHAPFVRIASAAVATKLLGGGRSEICSALSHAWCDGYPLRIYRQSPNVGPRKSWAGPDAAARGLQLAFFALKGEPACGSVIEDPAWGVEKRILSGNKLSLLRALGSYVMENVVFKTVYPGVIHAQTALEAAIKQYPVVHDKISEIQRIDIWSYSTAIRIASKTGALKNSADRDHCLEYMVAVGLLKGSLDESDFSDAAAQNGEIDFLREKMVTHEDPVFTAKFLDPAVRSCANGLQIIFRDGSVTPRINIEQPLGHGQRRVEGEPALKKKLIKNLSMGFPRQKVELIMEWFNDKNRFLGANVTELLGLFCK